MRWGRMVSASWFVQQTLVLVFLFLILPREAHSLFESTFMFRVEDCVTGVFKQEEPTDSSNSLGYFHATNTTCLDGKGKYEGYANATNGVSLQSEMSELISSFNMSDVLKDGWLGDQFTIAIWYSLDANAREMDQQLLHIDDSLTITPTGMEMRLGEDLMIGSREYLPPVNSPGSQMLLVLTVGIQKARIFRKVLDKSTITMKEFNMPEGTMQMNKIVYPRMRSWSSSSRLRSVFSGNLYGFRFFETGPMNQADINGIETPEWRPRCPVTQQSLYTHALEHSESIDISSMVVSSSISGTLKSSGQPLFKVLQQPFYGNMLEDDDTIVANYPAIVQRIVYRAPNGDLQRNDTLQVKVLSGSDQNCESASTTTLSIIVIPVNDPPKPTSVTVNVEKNGSTIVLGGVDPDGDVSEIRGGLARVTVLWTSNNTGTLFWGECNDPEKSEVVKDALIDTFANPLGAGWPVSMCYVPDFESIKLQRAVPSEVIGHEVFTFSLTDELGLESIDNGTVTLQIKNPAYAAVNKTFRGVEDQMLRFSLDQTAFSAKRAILRTKPRFGQVFSSPGQATGLDESFPESLGGYYLPDPDFYGQDSIQVQFEDVHGFLSSLINVHFVISNVVDTPRILLPSPAIQANLHQRTPINASLVSPDPDEYKIQLTVYCEDPVYGFISARNLIGIKVQVIRGTACIDVGCSEPIAVVGVLSELSQVVANLEYGALQPFENKIHMSLAVEDLTESDKFDRVYETSLKILSADGNLWGPNNATRGSRTVGVAILGSVVAFALVFGRGLWLCFPRSLRLSIGACVSKHLIGRKAGKDKPSVVNRAKLNPPANPSEFLMEWSSSPNRKDLIDIPKPPGLDKPNTIPIEVSPSYDGAKQQDLEDPIRLRNSGPASDRESLPSTPTTECSTPLVSTSIQGSGCDFRDTSNGNSDARLSIQSAKDGRSSIPSPVPFPYDRLNDTQERVLSPEQPPPMPLPRPRDFITPVLNRHKRSMDESSSPCDEDVSEARILELI